MADAWENKIADAIAAELNATSRPWRTLFLEEGTQAENARRAWFDAPEIASLKCTVVPATQDRTRLNRANLREFAYGIMVDLQRLLDPADMTLIRSLDTAAEQIQEFFDDGHSLTGLDRWLCLHAKRDDIFSINQLYRERTWETLIAIEVRGHR